MPPNPPSINRSCTNRSSLRTPNSPPTRKSPSWLTTNPTASGTNPISSLLTRPFLTTYLLKKQKTMEKIVPGTAGGQHIAGAPLTTNNTNAVAVGLHPPAVCSSCVEIPSGEQTSYPTTPPGAPAPRLHPGANENIAPLAHAKPLRGNHPIIRRLRRAPAAAGARKRASRGGSPFAGMGEGLRPRRRGHLVPLNSSLVPLRRGEGLSALH